MDNPQKAPSSHKSGTRSRPAPPYLKHEPSRCWRLRRQLRSSSGRTNCGSCLKAKKKPVRRMEKALKAFSIAFRAFSELCLSDTIDAPRFALISRLKIIRCYYIALSHKTQHSFCKNFVIHFRENFAIPMIMHRFQQKFRLHPSPQERFSNGAAKKLCYPISLLCFSIPFRLSHTEIFWRYILAEPYAVL